jgi:hypothetical protein
MAFKPGCYTIKCMSTDSYVGRFPAEDLSLLPKRVWSLPPDLQAPRIDVEESSEEGLYTIKGGGAPFGIYKDTRLSAFLLDDMATKTLWRIVPQSDEGDNIYTYDRASGHCETLILMQLPAFNSLVIKKRGGWLTKVNLVHKSRLACFFFLLDASSEPLLVGPGVTARDHGLDTSQVFNQRALRVHQDR